FQHADDIVPPRLNKAVTVQGLVEAMGRTSFEARKVFRAARLLERMVSEGDVIWVGIAGAGIAGGMGGMLISLMEAGFVDVICSTGAQVYHDLHFAFGLPVKAVDPGVDDEELRRCGDTRIYDIGIREKETLEAQDALIREFVRGVWKKRLCSRTLSSWEFNHALGIWTAERSPHPERSFVAAAARLGIPVFWDSLANHSITLNLLVTDREGFPVQLSAQRDVFDSAAVVYSSERTGFVELGGGGPKNFIQQTGPTLNQILQVPYEGADRGLQIGTAVEREGSLSSCTFGEAVSWGKYRAAGEDKLVQVWAEYSLVFPLLASYVLAGCSERPQRRLVDEIPQAVKRLEECL
ncbi:MAG: deoxyhypusine synthase family protein, partial [Desulfobacteraceae bacterium]